MSESSKDVGAKNRGRPPEEVINAIVEALSGMRFGQVTIIVQDGHVIQIDRVEKRRLKDGS
jgi:hypothetical protein